MSFMRSIFCPPFYKMVRSCYTICGGWTKYPGKEKPEVYRKRLSVSGVTDVESFDEETVALATELGELIIHGYDLLRISVSRRNMPPLAEQTAEKAAGLRLVIGIS